MYIIYIFYSMFFGNALTFWEFRGNVINESKRIVIFTTLALFATAGVFCMCFLRRPRYETILTVFYLKIIKSPWTKLIRSLTTLLRRPESSVPQHSIQTVPEVPVERPQSGLSAFKTSLRLFLKKEMILLSVVFFYTGAEGCFIWGVYSTSLGFTELFGADADRLVGLCGILIGAGEIVGGAIFSVLGSGSYKIGE